MNQDGVLRTGLVTAAHPSVWLLRWQWPGAPASNWLLSFFVEGPSPKTCAACGRLIAASELYYRFTLVLQGEQDVLDTSGRGTREELASILQQLEEGPQDPRELEEQVHWERKGVICTSCRAVVMRTLTQPPSGAGPH